jgi:hypothetical protein
MPAKSVRAVPPVPDQATSLYPDPWTLGIDPEPVDQLILATARADALAAHVAARLEARATTLDHVSEREEATEFHALSLCAVQIRQLLADVTRLAGAYLGSEPSGPSA